MKKKILFIALISLIQTALFSQSCLPEGIVFEQQSQIDSFPINYPNCSEIEGSVKIYYQYITNLDSLIYLEKVGGAIKIIDCWNLESLSGLDNISIVDSSLIIQNNPLLTTLSGLESLTTIGMDLLLENNRQISSLSALGNLRSIGMNLKIWNVDSITSLSGFEGLDSITASLEIRDCELLQNLTGFNNITTIGGQLGILQCNKLENLAGFENLTHIGYNIAFCCNPKLNSLEVLKEVTSNGWTLEINNNEILGSLEGLDDLGANSFQQVIIQNNPNLNSCEVETICNYLAQGKNYTIESNLSGCNNRNEILDACATVGNFEVRAENSKITISPNPATDHLNITTETKNTYLELKIFSTTGKLVLSESGLINKVDISSLNPGIYIIEISSSNGILKQKMIKK